MVSQGEDGERPLPLRRFDASYRLVEIDDVEAELAHPVDGELKKVRSHLQDGIGREVGRRIRQHAMQGEDDAA